MHGGPRLADSSYPSLAAAIAAVNPPLLIILFPFRHSHGVADAVFTNPFTPTVASNIDSHRVVVCGHNIPIAGRYIKVWPWWTKIEVRFNNSRVKIEV